MNGFLDNIFLIIAFGFLILVMILATNKSFIALDEKLENLKKKNNPDYPYGKDLTRFSCPVCNTEISRMNQFKNSGSFFRPELQCPHCRSMVQFDPKSSFVLAAGGLGFITHIGLLSYANMRQDFKPAIIIMGFASLALIFWGLSIRKLVKRNK